MPTSDLIFTLKHSCKTTAHIHQIYAQAIRAGLFSLYPSPLLTHILHSFPLSSPQQNANHSIIYFTKIFNLIPNPSYFNYNDIIRAHTFLRSPHTALILFLEMRWRSIALNIYTIPSVLKACELLRDSHSLAKALHAQVMKLGFLVDVFVSNTLSCTYCRFCDVDGAKRVFEGSLFRNVVSYNIMIDGLLKARKIDHARELFDEMLSSFRNVVSYTAMIDGFLKAGKIDHARELFDEMPSSFRNVVSYTAIIDGLSKAGKIDHARELFDETPSSFRNAVSYTAMIDGFLKDRKIDHAKELFDEMPSSFRDAVSYNAMIDGLSKAGKIDHARELFDEMPNSFRNVVSYTAMIDGLSKAGKIDHARELFDEMPSSFRDAVSYTSMIDGLSKAGKIDHARELFDEMPSSFRNAMSYNAMIDGLSKAGKIAHARKLFDEMPNSFRNVVSYTAMIDGLSKAGKIDHARKLFDEMPKRDAVTWGALLVGCAKWNYFVEAIELFHNMMDLWMEIGGVSLVSLLSACAQLGKMVKGKEIHGYIVRNGIKLDAYIGAALVDLYAKCGCIEMAKAVFCSCQEKNVTLWSEMLKGLAIHGQGGSLLQYFSRMLKDDVKPNRVTIMAILFGCSHSELINIAKRIFVKMESVYGVPREPYHYVCMVDVLACGGLIKEARKMIEGVPMEAEALVWKALLSGCKKYGDVELAEEAAKHLMQMTPEDGSVYLVMAVIYASIERWDDSVKMHCLRHCREVESIPGCSWIELDRITHKFFAGDRLYPEETYLVLNGLQQHLQHS